MPDLSPESLLLLAMQRPSLPKGLSLEDAVLLLVGRFGADAVKEAVKQLTKGKPGPKTLPDWERLLGTFRAEAQTLLSGDAGLQSRNAMARDFAETQPGNSKTSTQTRLRRKIKHRDWWVHVLALLEAEGAYPHHRYIAILEKLIELKDSGPKGTKEAGEMWETKLKRAQQLLLEYEQATGHCPDPELTFKAVEDAVLSSLITGARPTLGPLSAVFSDPGSGLFYGPGG